MIATTEFEPEVVLDASKTYSFGNSGVLACIRIAEAIMVCYYERLYSSYPTFMIRIDEVFQGEHPNYFTSKNPEKEHRSRRDTGLDVHEVAEILGCKPGLVYKLIKDGKLRSRRDGRLLRFTRENVDAYIRSQEKEGAEQRQHQQRKRKKFEPCQGQHVPNNPGVRAVYAKRQVADFLYGIHCPPEIFSLFPDEGPSVYIDVVRSRLRLAFRLGLDEFLVAVGQGLCYSLT